MWAWALKLLPWLAGLSNWAGSESGQKALARLWPALAGIACGLWLSWLVMDWRLDRQRDDTRDAQKSAEKAVQQLAMCQSESAAVIDRLQRANESLYQAREDFRQRALFAEQQRLREEADRSELEQTIDALRRATRGNECAAQRVPIEAIEALR